MFKKGSENHGQMNARDLLRTAIVKKNEIAKHCWE